MYVRKQQVPKGGKVHIYHQLVEGYREGGKVKIRVLAHLGKHPTPQEAIEAWEGEAALCRHDVRRYVRMIRYIRSGRASLSSRRYYGRIARRIPWSVIESEGEPVLTRGGLPREVVEQDRALASSGMYECCRTPLELLQNAQRENERAQGLEERARKVRALL